MKFVRLLFLLFVCQSLCAFTWPEDWGNAREPLTLSRQVWVEKMATRINAHQTNIDPKVLRLGLHAYFNAHQKGITDKHYLTVIDYSIPSTKPRLWVFDLVSGNTLFHTLVAHGKNSGALKTTSFSNRLGSLETSLGVFVTKKTYYGGDGYSLQLVGLEPGFNDHALARKIVVHGAWYVNPGTIQSYGQIGRSWGCIAVGTKVSRQLIDTIKDNTLIVSYYPNQNWLSTSQYLI